MIQNNNTFSSLPMKLYPNMWKSSAGIYALKTSGEEEEGGLRLSVSLRDHNDDKESFTVLF